MPRSLQKPGELLSGKKSDDKDGDQRCDGEEVHRMEETLLLTAERVEVNSIEYMQEKKKTNAERS